jgi:hypothetical protein
MRRAISGVLSRAAQHDARELQGGPHVVAVEGVLVHHEAVDALGDGE